jgi:hypothetical protein
VLSICLQAHAQQTAKFNPEFLSHLLRENLEIERLCYYRTFDFSENSISNIAQDLSYLSAKYNDSLLLQKYSTYVTDTNELVSIFYGAMLLHSKVLYQNIFKNLCEQNLSKNKLILFSEMIAIMNGEINRFAVSSQFYTTTERIKKLQSKSLFLATILSIVLPGAGKYYLMQSSEASSAILLNLITGAPLIEAIFRFGLVSAGTMLCGVVFIPVYVSSIYGTIKSKKVLLHKLQIQLKNEVHDYCTYKLHH